MNIYILLLEDNKYYVGKTNVVNFRLDQHFDGKGSAWTTKYKPQRLVNLINDCSKFDEDKFTLEYMSRYGINNVRGGSFCKLNLDDNDVNVIVRMINGSEDKCYRCNKKGHFINECQHKNNMDEKNISNQCITTRHPCYLEVSNYNTKFICYYYNFGDLPKPLTKSLFKLYVDREEKAIIQQPYIEKDDYITNSNIIINKLTNGGRMIGNGTEQFIKTNIDDEITCYLIKIFGSNIKIINIESHFYRSRTERLIHTLEGEWNTHSIISKRHGNKFLAIEMVLFQKMWISNVIYE